MRSPMVSTVLLATTASQAAAFLGSPAPTRFSASSWCPSRSYRSSIRMTAQGAEVDDDAPQVYYASEVTEGTKRTKLTEDLGEQPLPENTQAEDSERYGPVDYKGYVDSEGFDGGDGQVGVVGDGSNAMEQFDKSEVTSAEKSAADARQKVKATSFVKESKSRQRNAWGTSTGYADKLKDKGMVDINLAGEDMKKIRRQQLENWRNQQEVTMQQRAQLREMDRLAGGIGEGDAPKWKRGKDDYFDTLSKKAQAEKQQAWNQYQAPATTGKKDGTQWEETKLSGNEKVEATVQCVSVSGRPGHNTVEVRNTVMTFEPFHCTFVGDTDGFEVNPAEGTLARRGGEATTLDVSYLGSGPGDNRIGTLVVETEEDKWVFKVEGVMQ